MISRRSVRGGRLGADMGIEIHSLNLLAVAQDRGASFRRTMAVGRQGVHVEPAALEAHRQRRGLPTVSDATWFEPLLREWYGAETTDSVDASAYEGATHVHDLNLPWTGDADAMGSYDAVLDFGSLEHVFDLPTAWRTLVGLLRPGGHILHTLPCNNFVGHGFYQFSPELFFSLYSRDRGFALKGLWAVISTEPRYWWAVADPRQVRRRVGFANGHAAFLLVLAQKVSEAADVSAPQQSDYAAIEWQGQTPTPAVAPVARRHPASGLLQRLGWLDAARRLRLRAQAQAGTRLDLSGPDFTRVDVAALTRRPSLPLDPGE